MGIAIALFVLFLMLMLAIFSAINLLTNVDSSLANKAEEVRTINQIDKDKKLNIEDCQQLINEIYIGESKVYNSENHRYIEVVSSAENINTSYQKGAKELKSIAEQYLELDLNPESEYYSKMIGNKLKEKAKLFEQRVKMNTDNQSDQKLNTLLDKMDAVTEERLNAIESVENQCSANN